MKRTVLVVLSLLGVAVLGAGAQTSVPGNVVSLFEKQCLVCHKGKVASAGLSWERARIAEAIDKPSTEMPELKIIDTASPDASYLLKKVRRDKGIKGQPMPPAKALTADELKVLEDWVNGLKKYPAPASAAGSPENGAADPPPAQAGKPARPKGTFDTPAFWGTRLLDLPTTTTPDKGDVLVRISHRFSDRVEEGFDDLFGLDSYANILLSAGYGITNNLAVSVGRARLDKVFEFAADWLIAEQGRTHGLPVSVTLHGGVDLVTGPSPDEVQVFGAISLSRQFTRRLSVLVVPALATNADYWDLNPDSTFSLGLGARYMIFEGLSASVEWTPVLAGFRNVESGWGLGLEKKIGGHVFQVFVTNNFGLAAAQYLPGGDLRLRDFDFRIGFNIFRTF